MLRKEQAEAPFVVSEKNYEIVIREINDKWPRWKQEAFNNEFAVSAHAKKLGDKEGNLMVPACNG